MQKEFDTVLVYDTETTGMLDFKARTTASTQPDVVQLAASLYAKPTGSDHSEWRREAVLYSLICLGDSKIADGARGIHGISENKANALGLSRENALWAFADLCAVADVHVAHNNNFDRRIMECAFFRSGMEDNPLSKEKAVCTMMTSTPIVKAPKKTGKGVKWPSLEESMKFYFGLSVGEEFIEIDGKQHIHKYGEAHDAMPDVDACAKIYFELLRRKVL